MLVWSSSFGGFLVADICISNIVILKIKLANDPNLIKYILIYSKQLKNINSPQTFYMFVSENPEGSIGLV